MPTSDVQSVYGGGGGVADGNDQAKVSSNDTVTGYLNGKLVAGTNVTLTENNNGSNETLTISSADTNDQAKVSSNDTTAGYLNGKLVAGTNVTFTENNDGGNETLTISATGGGGGGVTGFTTSQNATTPNNTINASRLLVDAVSAEADIVLQPKGTGAILAQLPDNLASGGNKRGLRSVDLQTIRTSATQIASGTSSIIAGGENNTASGTHTAVSGGLSNLALNPYAVVCGGSTNAANGSRSFIGGGQGNTAGSSYSAIASGVSNTANGSYAIISGGEFNNASGSWAVIAGGGYNSASAIYSTVIGGRLNTASGEYSVASGYRAVANVHAMRSHASGRFIADGDAQVQEMVLRTQTTSGAQGELTADQLPWTTANTMQVPTDGALAFDILIVARRTDANNECAAWTIRGCIDNNAGVVAFVGTPTKTVLGDDSAGVWDVAADTDASQRLRVLCVGQVGKTINWVAHIRATRVVG